MPPTFTEDHSSSGNPGVSMVILHPVKSTVKVNHRSAHVVDNYCQWLFYFYTVCVCVDVLPALVSVLQVCAWCPQRSGEGIIRSRGTGVIVVSRLVDARSGTSHCSNIAVDSMIIIP